MRATIMAVGKDGKPLSLTEAITFDAGEIISGTILSKLTGRGSPLYKGMDIRLTKNEDGEPEVFISTLGIGCTFPCEQRGDRAIAKVAIDQDVFQFELH